MQERREIEAALHDGDLWAVAATNALELGVDVGSLDVTLHLGFPGMLAAFLSYCPAAFAAECSTTFLALVSPLLGIPDVLVAFPFSLLCCCDFLLFLLLVRLFCQLAGPDVNLHLGFPGRLLPCLSVALLPLFLVTM